MTTANRIARRCLHWVGSLWFAAVLLVLVLVALACATVFESMHGTEQTLTVFYYSPWFAVLLALLGLNILAAVLTRWPLPRAKLPFALTHTSLLLILVAALVTKYYGVEGQLALDEGSSSDSLSTDVPSVSIAGLTDGEPLTIDLPSAFARRLTPVDDVRGASVTAGTTTFSVLRLLPDSDFATEVTDDAVRPRTAVEAVVSSDGDDRAAWLFPDDPVSLGETQALLRVFPDETSVKAAASGTPSSDAMARVRVTYNTATHEWPLSACRTSAVLIGDTGMSLQVVDYYPHATVGSGGGISNASDRPENPAIRVRIVGPGGTYERLAFAKFPDFSMRRADAGEPDIKVTFLFDGGSGPAAARIEVLAVEDGPTFVRFNADEGTTDPQLVVAGRVVDTPWPGVRFTVRRRFDHARRRDVLASVDPPRETRVPGVLVAIQDGPSREELWLRKYEPRNVGVHGRRVELQFVDQRMPLGFRVTLDDFTIRYYPGTHRPRSFESRVTIDDPTDGATSRLISMNNPVTHRGYSFFQSSYRGETMSVLSVSRDPGQPIVFTGYFALMAGMICVVITRARARAAESSRATSTRELSNGVCIDLLAASDRCLSDGPPTVGVGPVDRGRAVPTSKPVRSAPRDRVGL